MPVLRRMSTCDRPRRRSACNTDVVEFMTAVYSISNSFCNSILNYSVTHSAAMEPRELLEMLMRRDGDNPSSLARKLENAVRQPQIHKFLRGAAREPRRATLSPLAVHYGVPLDAFYDHELADQVAQQMGLTEDKSGLDVREPEPVAPPLPISKAIGRWPFSVPLARIHALPPEALQDIDGHIEYLVTKWEGAATRGKQRLRS